MAHDTGFVDGRVWAVTHGVMRPLVVDPPLTPEQTERLIGLMAEIIDGRPSRDKDQDERGTPR